MHMSAKIDVSPNIDAYFEQIVHDAIQARRVEATEAAEQYLAGMLSDYARGGQPRAALDKPLTFQLRDALEARGADRFKRLQAIGDSVLYLVGFFSQWLKRHGADRAYVITVGSSAYGHASAMLRMGGNESSHDVLLELSSKYDRFVTVMHEVADGALAGVSSNSGVLKMYERYLETGSASLMGTLVDAGLCPPTRPGGGALN
jgi:hypothetical protein